MGGLNRKPDDHQPGTVYSNKDLLSHGCSTPFPRPDYSDVGHTRNRRNVFLGNADDLSGHQVLVPDGVLPTD